jgi:hypothetical protein
LMVMPWRIVQSLSPGVHFKRLQGVPVSFSQNIRRMGKPAAIAPMV